MKPSPAWLSVCAGLILATVTVCRGDNFVTVFTSATPAYLKKRADKGSNKVETYIFMPGRFLESSIRDHSVERAKFVDVAKALVPGLHNSSYVPAKSVTEADLLLVVHWGVTKGNGGNSLLDMRDPQDVYDLRQTYTDLHTAEVNAVLQEGGPGSSVTPSMILATGLSRQYQDDLQFQQVEKETKTSPYGTTFAELLGFSAEFAKDERRPVASEMAKTLASLLEKDRYFLVIMAYDWQHWLKERKMVRVWVSRLSIPSPGVNFQIAVHRMNLAGGDSFGTSNPELFMVKTKRKKQTEKVTTGDLIFVGFDKDKEADKGEKNRTQNGTDAKHEDK